MIEFSHTRPALHALAMAAFLAWPGPGSRRPRPQLDFRRLRQRGRGPFRLPRGRLHIQRLQGRRRQASGAWNVNTDSRIGAQLGVKLDSALVRRGAGDRRTALRSVVPAAGRMGQRQVPGHARSGAALATASRSRFSCPPITARSAMPIPGCAPRSRSMAASRSPTATGPTCRTAGSTRASSM
ncbi:hypothetical protein LP420_04950 [Massilia sp. B-10]|nr:hypothetical protein LP420_04950 [Massilia sp. B-10]